MFCQTWEGEDNTWEESNPWPDLDHDWPDEDEWHRESEEEDDQWLSY